MRQEQPSEQPEEMKDFIEQLTSFEAHSFSANRDQLMFEAGQIAARAAIQAEAANMRGMLRIWQSVALVLFAFSLGLGTSLALRFEPQVQVVIAEPLPLAGTNENLVHTTGTDSATEALSNASRLLRNQRRVETSSGTKSDASSQQLIESLHERLALIEQAIEINFHPDGTQTPSKELVALSHQRASEPALNHRSLLQGEGSRILINRLIEEPNL